MLIKNHIKLPLLHVDFEQNQSWFRIPSSKGVVDEPGNILKTFSDQENVGWDLPGSSTTPLELESETGLILFKINVKVR